MYEHSQTLSQPSQKDETLPKQSAPWQRLGHQLKMGLRSRPESDWLPFSDLFGNRTLRAKQIALKANLSKTNQKDIFAAHDGSRVSGAEVFAMVDAHLKEHQNTDGLLRTADRHPLDDAARQIPEDLLILAPHGQGNEQRWHLLAGALAFPAHWVLAEKMGKPLAEIHEPVPHYSERLETAMDRFFNAMQTGPISGRMNWSLQAGEDYFAPHRNDRPSLNEHSVPTGLFLRVENQTLRKLPSSGHILFTIRTHMVPFGYWQNQPDAIADLLTMMQEMSSAARDYKGVHLYEAPLQAWSDTLKAN